VTTKTAIQTQKTRPPSWDGGRAAENTATGMGLAAYSAAGLSLLAALIHLWVAPEHFEHWWGYGAFFLICALAQGMFVTLLLKWPRSRLILIAGIWGNLAIVSLYVISRTWGMPIGPDLVPFSPSVAHLEDPEILGMTATLAEMGIILASVALLRGAWRRWTVNALLLVGGLIWGLRLAGIIP
jgi:hypothetical protein